MSKDGLQAQIEHILSPAIDINTPYAKIMVNKIMGAVEDEIVSLILSSAKSEDVDPDRLWRRD